MDGCRKRRKDLLLYVDRELDPDRAIAFESHLEECPLCAAFVERNAALEEAIESTLSPALDRRRSAAFVDQVRARVEASGAATSRKEGEPGSAGHAARAGRSSRPARIVWTLVPAAAAALFLFWLFHAIPTPDGAGSNENGSPAEANRSSGRTGRPGPSGAAGATLSAADRQRHEKALERAAALLASLGEVPGSRLAKSFAREAESLRREGWRVDHLVAGVLKSGDGPALATAIRLARVRPGFEKVPEVIETLKRLTGNADVAHGALRALASYGARRARSAVGAALGDPALRNAALAHLAAGNDPDAAARIADAAIAAIGPDGNFPPFVAVSIRSLAGMGDPGMKGILEICGRAGCSRALVRALTPIGDATAETLIRHVEDTHASRQEAAIRLAAALRFEDALPELHPRLSATEALRNECPDLIARIGGPVAVVRLATLYEEPVSLRDRRALAAGLAALFEIHAEETDRTLAEALAILAASDRTGETLVEMLTQVEAAGSCLALVWFVEKKPSLASRAALGLARSGSPEALALLLELIRRGSLDEETRLAAAAAAYFLGGRPVLDRILDEGNARKAPDAKADIPEVRRSAGLSSLRFRKIQKYIAKHARP